MDQRVRMNHSSATESVGNFRMICFIAIPFQHDFPEALAML